MIEKSCSHYPATSCSDAELWGIIHSRDTSFSLAKVMNRRKQDQANPVEQNGVKANEDGGKKKKKMQTGKQSGMREC